MNSLAKWALFILSLGVSIWDVITTYQGIDRLASGGFLPIILTIVVNGVLAATYIDLGATDNFMKSLTGFLWFIALVTDFITSWVGNMQLANFQNFDIHKLFDGNFENLTHLLIAGVMALFTTGSTILVSYFVLKGKLIESKEQ